MAASIREWTINGDFLALATSGVPRYAREVTRALDALIAEGHPAADGLHLRLVGSRPADALGLRRIAFELVPEFRHPRLPQVWVQFQLPRHVRGGLLSFCNLAPVTPTKHIVCIHDLHTRLMPEGYGRGFRWAHHVLLPLLGRRAYAVTTVSGLSAQHLAAFGVAPPHKIVVAYNGCDHVRSWSAARSQLPLGLRPFVLFFGHGAAYKNAALIERLAPRLHQIGLDVLITGKPTATVDEVPTPEVPSNIRRLGYVSDDDLALLLSRATCLLLPSRIEGFGLPAVEAMALGCAVVASTAPALPEVCGEAALFADPDDDDAWFAAVARIADERGLRERLVRRGRMRAARFTWGNVASRYLELMADADVGRAPRSDVRGETAEEGASWRTSTS